MIISQEAEAALRAANLYDIENFSSVGPAGIFALYANPAAPLGEVFLNEFVSVCGRSSVTWQVDVKLTPKLRE